MKQWQKLTEKEMDLFTDFVLQKLHVSDYDGCDIEDIYEKALSLQHQKTIHDSEYMAALPKLKYFQKLLSEQKDLDPEIQEIVYEHFWELF